MSVNRYEFEDYGTNEPDGRYVTYEDYSELEARCAAMAAENAGLKKFCKDAAFDADYEAELGMERGGFTDALNDIKTPATAAFLAEVRAQGVDLVCDYHKSRCEALHDVDRIGSQRHGAALCDAIDIAYQLLKGVQS